MQNQKKDKTSVLRGELRIVCKFQELWVYVDRSTTSLASTLGLKRYLKRQQYSSRVHLRKSPEFVQGLTLQSKTWEVSFYFALYSHKCFKFRKYIAEFQTNRKLSMRDAKSSIKSAVQRQSVRDVKGSRVPFHKRLQTSQQLALKTRQIVCPELSRSPPPPPPSSSPSRPDVLLCRG